MTTILPSLSRLHCVIIVNRGAIVHLTFCVHRIIFGTAAFQSDNSVIVALRTRSRVNVFSFLSSFTFPLLRHTTCSTEVHMYTLYMRSREVCIPKNQRKTMKRKQILGNSYF